MSLDNIFIRRPNIIDCHLFASTMEKKLFSIFDTIFSFGRLVCSHQQCANIIFSGVCVAQWIFFVSCLFFACQTEITFYKFIQTDSNAYSNWNEYDEWTRFDYFEYEMIHTHTMRTKRCPKSLSIVSSYQNGSYSFVSFFTFFEYFLTEFNFPTKYVHSASITGTIFHTTVDIVTGKRSVNFNICTAN